MLRLTELESHKDRQVKKISLITMAVNLMAVYPAQARNTDATKGVAVIGVRGDIALGLVWRQFDPTTGKLLPFSVARNVGTGTRKALSNLFSGLGRLGRGDKRYDASEAGVSYRMSELPPGSYVLEAVNADGRRSVFNGSVPIVRVSAGQASYAGDYTVTIDKDEGGRAIAAGRTVSGARAFLATFPKVKSPLVDGDSGTATLDCRGKSVAFADQLVCDSDRSLVSNITFTSVGQ